ncbi:MAG TPA: hypothetical protein VIF60_20120 [Burkholderiaceae bacterium]|jgi:hypothetical protein
MHRMIRSWATYLAVFGTLFLGAWSSLAAAAEMGNEALLGTWQGKLVISPSSQLIVQFIVTRDAQNKYSAVLNAPDEANLQNVAVSAFSLKDGKVVFAVDEVSGSFDGALKDKKMTGKWKQNGASFDLVLAPAVREKIPAEMIVQLNGPWNGVLSIPATDRKVNLVLHFKPDNASDSGLSATIDCPDQAIFGFAADSVTLQGGTLRVNVLRPQMSFKGKIAGGQLVGTWSQGGDIPLTLNKGKFQISGLNVDKSIREKLNGEWYGKFSNGMGMSLRFKDDQNGTFSAFLDSPYEGRNNVPVSAITLNGDNVSLRMEGVNASFTGVLGKNSIDGKFFAGDQGRSLTFSRGEYIPEVVHVSSDLANKLIGKWVGKSGNTDLILRFQLNEKGNLIALQDIPNRRLFSLPVSDVSFKENDLSLVVKGIAAEFKGKVSKNEISGNWVMPNLQFPLTLSRSTN